MKEYLEKLNKEQLEAATTINGNLLILAGAGSGKTATLVARVANMIDSGISPKNILLLTFTNKAAKEMQNRAVNLIGADANDITACTFHSFCANLLRKNAYLIGYKTNFVILDNVDAVDAISICKENFIENAEKKSVKYDYKDFPSAKEIQRFQEVSLNSCKNLEEVVSNSPKSSYYNEIKAIIDLYIKYKRSRNLVDYNDLLYLTEKLLKENEALRKLLDERFKYISCDEYQDTNTIQNEILELLSKDFQNLAVVGDDNQSIYKFRCAEIENIINFDKNKKCKKIVLSENYRSSQEILDLANIMMSYAKEGIPKILHGQFNGNKPEMLVFNTPYEQSRYIAERIYQINMSGTPLNDIAVIVRSARQTFQLEIFLNKIGIPYEKYGGIKFTEKSTVKDILAFLKICTNNDDEISLYRILQLYTGIGKGRAKTICSEIKESGCENIVEKYKGKKFYNSLLDFSNCINKLQTLSLKEQLDYLLEDYYPTLIEKTIDNMNVASGKKSEKKISYQKQIEEAKSIKHLAENYKTTLAFLSDLTLDAVIDDVNKDKLNITTIHSAKGLEYNTVFFLDLMDGITPRCNSDSKEDPEELRCAYVAITRAKEHLYLTYSHYDKGKIYELSHFINSGDILDTINCREIS